MSIEIKNISKNFGSVAALSDISLSFESGKIYGLLGRNGAGKSTLLNILTGRILADKGSLTLDGEPIFENNAALSKIYLMSEKTLYPENMKIRNAFRWSGEFYPGFDLEYANAAAEKFSLSTKKKVKALSTGYTSIFKLILALSSNAPYIIFDEPVLGLDANHRDIFYKMLLQKYAENACCVIISTHLIEEISALIENVAIIKSGSLIKQESRETLLSDAFCVSGLSSLVDSFAAGRDKIGEDLLGSLKVAYIRGERPESAPEGLEISTMDLQKLFIHLTNT